jgi:hypothetical protein
LLVTVAVARVGRDLLDKVIVLFHQMSFYVVIVESRAGSPEESAESLRLLVGLQIRLSIHSWRRATPSSSAKRGFQESSVSVGAMSQDAARTSPSRN